MPCTGGILQSIRKVYILESFLKACGIMTCILKHWITLAPPQQIEREACSSVPSQRLSLACFPSANSPLLHSPPSIFLTGTLERRCSACSHPGRNGSAGGGLGAPCPLFMEEPGPEPPPQRVPGRHARPASGGLASQGPPLPRERPHRLPAAATAPQPFPQPDLGGKLHDGECCAVSHRSGCGSGS